MLYAALRLSRMHESGIKGWFAMRYVLNENINLSGKIVVIVSKFRKLRLKK